MADRFSTVIIYHIRQHYHLENRFERLRREGLLTLQEMTAGSGLAPATIKNRAGRGQLVSYIYNDKGQRLYAPPGEPAIIACLHCGKLMPERVKHGQKRKYCTVSCRTGACARRRAVAGWVRVRRH